MFTRIREARRIIQQARKPYTPIQEKPFRLTIELSDGQWRTWKLGVGDAVGLGGIRVDVQGTSAILVTTYDEADIGNYA